MSAATSDFVYVRVPRTGSTTFLHYLEKEFDLTDVGSQHATAAELWGLCDWDNLFTFGFIRNPWDWLVSVYNSGISVGDWPGARIEPYDTPGIHPGQRCNATFDEWAPLAPTPLDWLSTNGEIAVKRIYLFENFIKGVTVRKSAVPHSHYRTWYTPALAGCVAEKCRREIVLGGYTF